MEIRARIGAGAGAVVGLACAASRHGTATSVIDGLAAREQHAGCLIADVKVLGSCVTKKTSQVAAEAVPRAPPIVRAAGYVRRGHDVPRLPACCGLLISAFSKLSTHALQGCSRCKTYLFIPN